MRHSEEPELADVCALNPEARALEATVPRAAADADETTPRQARVALAATAALLLFCVLVWSPDSVRSDFGPMYAAGYMVTHGDRTKLYDLGEQHRVQAAVVGRRDLLPFLHPPFAALVFAPLAVLPYPLAFAVWGVFNIALWIGFVLLMRRFVPVPQQLLRYFLLCFLFWPCWIVLRQGQTSLVLLFVYALTFACFRKNRDFQGGALLGLGLLKYHFVLPFVAILLLRRRWRSIAGFAAVALASSVLSAAVVGWSGSLSYAWLVFSTLRDPGFLAVQTQAWPSLGGFLGVLAHGAAWTRLAAAGVSATLIVVAAWRWRKEDRREDGGSQQLAFALAITVALAATPYIFYHDLSLLLLPLLLAIASPAWHSKRTWRLTVIASIAPLYLPPLWVVMVNTASLYWLCTAVFAFAVALFLLVGWPYRAVDVTLDSSRVRLHPSHPETRFEGTTNLP